VAALAPRGRQGPLAALGRALHALEAEIVIGTTVPSSESLSQGGISFGRDGTNHPQSQDHPASYRIALAKPTCRHRKEGAHAVPVFVTQGRYSQSAVKAMLAQPEDRGGAVARLIE
jgi:hypothetical protein